MRSGKSVAASSRSTNPRTTATSVWSLLPARRNAIAWPYTCCIRDLVRALTRRRPSLDEANTSYQKVRSIVSSLVLRIISQLLSCGFASRLLTDILATDRTASGKRTASVTIILWEGVVVYKTTPSPGRLAIGNGRLRLLLAPAMWHHGHHFLIDTFFFTIAPDALFPVRPSSPRLMLHDNNSNARFLTVPESLT